METSPCHTCVFHEGGWQNCKCQVCLEKFHDTRCVHDQIMHCVFYRQSQNERVQRAG